MPAFSLHDVARSGGAALLLVFAAATPGAAQSTQPMPPGYRAVQRLALEGQRDQLLRMVDSMPERLYRDAVTPVQRDFAQQVVHASGASALAVTLTSKLPTSGMLDTAGVHDSRAALTAYVQGTYDYLLALLARQSEDARHTEISFAGRRIPAWQLWDELNEHFWWTAGEIVANFRKHGMEPPAFRFYPAGGAGGS